MANTLSPVATDVKKKLKKRGQSAAQIAAALGRAHGKGLGPILQTLVNQGLAVRNTDGTYSKA
jgi:hypothetical protein